jgi:dTDP-4-dehydrorhamnose reductase
MSQPSPSKDCVLIIGASGFLGSSLVPHLRREGYGVIAASRSPAFADSIELQPNRSDDLRRTIDNGGVACVVNLAAATDVDKCESDVPHAFDANAALPRSIAQAVSASHSKPFIVHVSSDQVYRGEGNHQEDQVGPVNVYGLSKLAGEGFLAERECAILRTNFFGKSRAQSRTSFSDWVVESLRRGRKVTLFDDVIFNGLHVDSLCAIIEMIISRRIKGTFNLGSRGKVSKAAFAVELARHLGLSTSSATIGTLAEKRLLARRPLDMSMAVDRIEHALGICCPDIHVEIRRAAKEYQHDEGL